MAVHGIEWLHKQRQDEQWNKYAAHVLRCASIDWQHLAFSS